MKGRRLSREAAYKIIFETTIRGEECLEDLKNTLSRQLDDEESREFAYKLIIGWKEQQQDLISIISEHLVNWDIKRLSVTDKVLMMMAIFEMKYCDDIPAVVSMDEAIELAKKYSSKESPSFMNGVLDSFHKSCST